MPSPNSLADEGLCQSHTCAKVLLCRCHRRRSTDCPVCSDAIEALRTPAARVQNIWGRLFAHGLSSSIFDNNKHYQINYNFKSFFESSLGICICDQQKHDSPREDNKVIRDLLHMHRIGTSLLAALCLWPCDFCPNAKCGNCSLNKLWSRLRHYIW